MAKKIKKNEPKQKQPNPDTDIDYWRQLDIFSPTKFKTPITVIGAGATGSFGVLCLAKMGCKNITVYDYDVIENYNQPNQFYGPSDTGLLKVNALKTRIQADTNIVIKAMPKKFSKGELKGIVFVLTDTMKSRKEIWESSIRYQLNVDLLIETRLEAEGGRIYIIKPLVPKQVEEYEKTLYSDEEAEESPCTRRSIASTVFAIVGTAVSQMVNFTNGKSFPNEIIMSLSPLITLTKKFE